MNVNNFGPRNLAGDMKKAIDNAKKLDEGKALGEAQQANTNNKPEGDTDVNKTVIVTWSDPDSEGCMHVKNVFYDGIDNGVIIDLNEDGSFSSISVNEVLHNSYKPEGA